MPPPNGSDSERLMAEIEAYLRTGEGPPAAPEPATPSALATRPYEAGAPDAGSGGRSGSGGARGRRARTGARPFGRFGRVGGRRRQGGDRPWKGLTFASGSPWSRLRSRRPSGVDPEPPRWTPARAVLVIAVLVGLLLIPQVWPQHHGSSNPDGQDQASSAPAGPGYAFLRVNRSGTPVRWNPCAAIPYQLDLAAAPAWAQADIADAVARMSQATGIAFDYQGTTNQLPTGQIPPGAGAAESPVVIAWASPQQSRTVNLPVDQTYGSASAAALSPAGGGGGASSAASGASGPNGAAGGSSASPGSGLAADAGVGGSPDGLARTVLVASTDQVTGHTVYVSGSVVISAAASNLPAGFGPGGDGILLLHELGRLVGLADVPATGEVMNPQVLSTRVTGFGPGDRAGLQRLGTSSGCLATPSNGTLETVF